MRRRLHWELVGKKPLAGAMTEFSQVLRLVLISVAIAAAVGWFAAPHAKYRAAFVWCSPLFPWFLFLSVGIDVDLTE